MKKILFNDKYNLTQAVLDGRKTMTRRIIHKEFFTLQWDVRGDTLVYENANGDFIDIRNSKYNGYKVGEVVAIAQSYKDLGFSPEKPLQEEVGYYHHIKNAAGWSNKMFVRADLMPNHIRITNVRVEKLQAISGGDCIKEGIEQFDTLATKSGKAYTFGCVNESYLTPREAFAALIEKVSGKGTWQKNPWVFAYEFELID